MEDDEEPYGWIDSGASSTYVAPQDKKHCRRTGIASDKQVSMPNGKQVAAEEKLHLDNQLREPANIGDSIPQLKKTLISNGKIADADYITVYDKEEVNVYDARTTQVTASNAAVMTGYRDKRNGLWRFPLKSIVENENTDTKLCTQEETNAILQECVANVYDLPSTEALVKYLHLHAAAGFPTKTTWLKAIKAKYYATWPGLTEFAVRKYFPESEETQRGHMRQRRSNIRKTNRKVRFVMTGPETDVSAIDDSIRELQRKKYDIMIKVYNCTDSVYTDQTGQFPVTSSRRNKYIMVLCEIDGNQILVEPMTNRTEGTLIRTHKKLIDRLKSKGIHPKI